MSPLTKIAAFAVAMSIGFATAFARTFDVTWTTRFAAEPPALTEEQARWLPSFRSSLEFLPESAVVALALSQPQILGIPRADAEALEDERPLPESAIGDEPRRPLERAPVPSVQAVRRRREETRLFALDEGLEPAAVSVPEATEEVAFLGVEERRRHRLVVAVLVAKRGEGFPFDVDEERLDRRRVVPVRETLDETRAAGDAEEAAEEAKSLEGRQLREERRRDGLLEAEGSSQLGLEFRRLLEPRTQLSAEDSRRRSRPALERRRSEPEIRPTNPRALPRASAVG